MNGGYDDIGRNKFLIGCDDSRCPTIIADDAGHFLVRLHITTVFAQGFRQ